jgi:hypothetical protein
MVFLSVMPSDQLGLELADYIEVEVVRADARRDSLGLRVSA